MATSPLSGGAMDIAPVSGRVHRPGPNSPSRRWGFSLLEMMMVVTLILIIASISTPIYMTAMVRAREAVLRDHLYTLRALIDRFTLDNGRAPLRLEELVEENGVRYPFQESSYGVVFRHGKSKAGRCRR